MYAENHMQKKILVKYRTHRPLPTPRIGKKRKKMCASCHLLFLTFNISKASLAKHKYFCETFANILSSRLPLRMIIGLAHYLTNLAKIIDIWHCHH